MGNNNQNRPKQHVWRVVWALGACFFYLLTADSVIFRSYLGTGRFWVGNDNQNGPKRRVWGVIWALGHLLGACFILACFLLLTTLLTTV